MVFDTFSHTTITLDQKPGAGRRLLATEASRHPRGPGTAGAGPASITRFGFAITLAMLAVLLMTGCAAGPNTAAQTDAVQGVGFWFGLWQGLISPITFLISLFTPEVNIYEVHNNGNWYNFGFMLGVSIAFGGLAGTGGAARRR